MSTPDTDRAEIALGLALTPEGRFRLARAVAEGSGAGFVAARVAARLEAAFAESPGAGLLHLGGRELGSALPPSLSYGRELARVFFRELCVCGADDLQQIVPTRGVSPAKHLVSPDATAQGSGVALAAPAAELARLSLGAPPMPGAEYLDADTLLLAWAEMEGALRCELEAHGGDVGAWVQGLGPGWRTVGRVCFHLAENKQDVERPFAFLATYARELNAAARVQHVPLARSLQEYAGAGDKPKLLNLLEPVQRAAERSEIIRGMLSSRSIYRPLAWTAKDAYAFLRDVPVFEESGVVVRVPDWWRRRAAARPQVSVRVGGGPPTGLGVRSLLEFDLRVTLDGADLSEDEMRDLLEGGSGLRLLRGRWVEVDAARLREVLEHWRRVEREADEDGLSFIDGMRLLAGVSRVGAGDGLEPETLASWSEVSAGAWLSEMLARLQRPEEGCGLDPGDVLRGTLRPYQREGVAWMRLLAALGLGGCLADDMGLGKTVQVLALMLLLDRRRSPSEKVFRLRNTPRRGVLLQNARPAYEEGLPEVPGPHLVVMPASLLGNWRAEIARFAPSLRTLTAHRSAMPPDQLKELEAGALDGVDAVLTTYATLSRLGWMTERAWGLVVLDEAQAVKNPGTRQSRSVKRLKSHARLALTGTPIENRLSDLWSLFDFLCPGLLGSAAAFDKQVKAMESDAGRGFAPLRALTRSYILRRLKSDKRIIADLPDKVEVRDYCGLTETQAALYEQAVADLQETLESTDGMARRGAVLASILRFKQICDHPSLWLGDGSFEPARSGKLRRLVAICEEIAARQERLLVFTQFREMCDPLARALGDVFGRPGLVLHGQTPVGQRPHLVERFQASDGPPFFVLSLRAGGTGLNLTAASHVVHFDRWWNPAVENQATDRAYRIGQKKNVLVHKLVCRGTVEEKIDALIAERSALAEELLAGTGEAWLTELDGEELLRVVSLDLASAMEES